MKLVRQSTDKSRNPCWRDTEAVNGGEVVFVSVTLSSQQCIPDELLQVLGSFMNPVSIILDLLSVSRHLSGLYTHIYTYKIMINKC